MNLLMPLVLVLCFSNVSISSSVDYHVGVILDMDSVVGSIGKSCLSKALSDFYSAHGDYQTRLILHPVHSDNAVGSAVAALDLLKDVKVDAIIGPDQESALHLVMEMGDSAHVPVISFTSTSPLINQAPYFVRTAQSDANQVEAIASVVKAFHWRQAVIIYEGTEFGSGIIPYLSNALHKVGAQVSHMSVLPKSATAAFIRREVNKLKSMPTRVFVVHVSQSLGTKFFREVNRLGMMSEGYVWIVTTELMDLFNFADSEDVEAMLGVVGVRPLIPKSKGLQSFDAGWMRPFNQGVGWAGMSIFGLWAYDTLWALATAAERVGNNGVSLHKALLETRFYGLAGEFSLVDGQLEQTAYQIFNLVGSNEKQLVGTWTPHVRSENKFESIIWPGNSSKAPRGWEFPANGSELIIGVPQKSSFDEYLKVDIDKKTNDTKVSGYYYEVFEAVMKMLPYNVTRKYKAYPIYDPIGSGARSYDDLIHHVSLQEDYSGALGDISITANRSDVVDFTLPFAEGGVACIVPMKYEDANGVLAFLKPLSKNLWLAICLCYIFTSLVIWSLSKRIVQRSRDFQSPHIGMICYLPFFPGQGIEANLLCVIVVIWAVVAILVCSTYTANLSSILTVARLEPSATSVQQLIKRGGSVGYQEASFLHTYLRNLRFDESKLKSFSSFLEIDKALSQQNISGFCDVMPHINYILSRGCGKYQMVSPVYHTVGFAFAFPKGYPAVADISRAILELTYNGTIQEMEKKMMSSLESCAGSGSSSSPTTRVSLTSFSGLFTLAVCLTLACLVMLLLHDVHKKKSLLQKDAPAPHEVQLAQIPLA